MITRNDKGQFIGNEPVKRICLNCKKEFIISGSSMSRRIKTAKFCSTKCRYAYPRSPETKNKIRLSMMGEKNPFYGKHHSDEVKNKIRKNRIGKTSNENHPLWKGEHVGYDALHRFIYRKLGNPIKCFANNDECSGRLEYANKSRLYKRDLDDWITLCRYHHAIYDRGHRGAIKKKFTKKL